MLFLASQGSSMSNFNPHARSLNPQEWRTLAAKNVIREADSASRDFVISALLGLLATGLTGMVPVGVGIVGCGILRGWRKNNLMDRRIKAIQQGCAAPFLDEMQLRRFTQQTGLDEALKQIHWAIEEAVEVLPTAEDLYALHGASFALPEAPNTEPAVIDVEAQTSQDSQPIADSPSGAVGTQSSVGVIQDSPIASHGTAIVTKSLLDVVAENPKSSFFSAPARTGKGITITACIRLVQARVKAGTLSKVTFWAMTPKQDPQENWYWETCDQFFNPDIETGDRAIAARAIYDFIKAFTALARTPQSPTILVVDELTRLVGLLKGIKMEIVDPELFSGDAKTFSDWLVDKLIYSASMSQSVGFYVWVATPSSAVGNRGFTKGDIDSLNLYTLATQDNLKFADGGSAAFSAPKTEAHHPVFTRGYGAGYCHQNKRWYHVPDLTQQIAGRLDRPVRLHNLWVADGLHDRASPIATAIAPPSFETEAAENKATAQRPNLTRTELSLAIAELSEWLDGTGKSDVAEIYSGWKGGRKKHGFTRPEIRFLLTAIAQLE
jgi:hypothetical protein